MSHKKTISTVYQDKDVLEQALREAAAAFSFTVAVGNLTARMYNGENVPVAMCIQRNHDYASWYYGDFGIAQKADGTFQIVIDDLDEKRERVQAFVSKLAQYYGYRKTIKDFEEQGFIVSKEAAADAEGNIRFKMRPTRRVLEVQTANTEKQPAQVAVWR